MTRSILFILLLSVVAAKAFAQDDLFGGDKMPPRKGFIIGVNGNLDFPGGDMAKRFGTSYRVGPSVLYKTRSNWVMGAKFDFILGDRIKQDSLMINIRDENGDFLNQDGQRIGVQVYQRGYMAGIQGGKIFSTSKKNSDKGIMVLTTVGFMQHKINIFDKEKTIPQLRDDYRKGYDRLSNGMFIEQYVGYSHFDNGGFLNFHIGLDVTAGFTKGRRDFLYDVMRTENDSRIDILFGIRGGWYIPVFKRKSEELFFE